MKSCDFFTSKGTSLRESSSFEPFLHEDWWRGLTSRGEQEKSEKFRRGSHRNDVLPLTQGSNYRSACDGGFPLTYTEIHLNSGHETFSEDITN